jgi:hypothetical protein
MRLRVWFKEHLKLHHHQLKDLKDNHQLKQTNVQLKVELPTEKEDVLKENSDSKSKLSEVIIKLIIFKLAFQANSFITTLI